MLRRIIALIAMLALLSAALPGSAEATASAVHDPSCFYGAWSVRYYVENSTSHAAGASSAYPALTLIISEKGVQASMEGSDQLTGPFPITLLSGNSFISDGVTMTQHAPDLMVGTTPDNLAIVLQRTGPAPFDSPFGGTWVVLAGAENGEFFDAQVTPFPLSFTFEADRVVISAANSSSSQSFPCVYSGNTCEFTASGQGDSTATAVLDEAGLIIYTAPAQGRVLLLVRAQ